MTSHGARLAYLRAGYLQGTTTQFLCVVAYSRKRLSRFRVPQLALSILYYGAIYGRLLQLTVKQVPNTAKYLKIHTFKFGTFTV